MLGRHSSRRLKRMKEYQRPMESFSVDLMKQMKDILKHLVEIQNRLDHEVVEKEQRKLIDSNIASSSYV